MQFNSPQFIFVFVPLALVGFYWLGRHQLYRAALFWILVASLVFYGWWSPKYLILLGVSLLVNYGFGALLGRAGPVTQRRLLLTLGLVFNIGLLGYFKYAGFFVEMVNTLTTTGFPVPQIVLPLAISFYSFQQIAYLVDAYQGKAQESSFLHYCLFILFFPQLIAGPIVHHKEMMPQFAMQETFRFDISRLSVGLTIFGLGLFKKVILADNVVELTQGVYSSASNGADIQFLEAWLATIGYTCQIYFDFSGYSDMAIGLGWMFGIMLPLNFSSPLRSTSMIRFWSTWHMTLSRFLRDYLYVPLGANNNGAARGSINMLIVMLIGGLWHGAGWNFVIWGGLQGLYLMINVAWHHLTRGLGVASSWVLSLYRVMTFTAFVISVVFFRSDSFATARQMLFAMFGGNGFAMPDWAANIPGFGTALTAAGVDFLPMPTISANMVIFIVLLITILWVYPNTQQIMRNVMGSIYIIRAPTNFLRSIVWQPSDRWGVVIGLTLFVSIISLWETSEFIYYQF